MLRKTMLALMLLWPPTCLAQTQTVNCTASAGDTSAIQNAIDALTSGIVNVVGANCLITSTISLPQGIVLQGLGMPNTQPAFSGYSTTGPKFTWSGSGSYGIIEVYGPLQGWSIKNLYLDCNNAIAAYGLVVVSAQFGDVSNLTIVNCQRGLVSDTVSPQSPYMDTNSQHNSYKNISIEVPASDGAIGMLVTGLSSADTCYNTFENVSIYLPATSNYTYGAFVQAADSNVFTSLHISAGGPNAKSVNFDYTAAPNFPSGNFFLWLDPYQSGGGVSFAQGGTPGPVASPNYVVLNPTHSASCPSLANFACTAP
jgi:hypothetical protein